MKWLGRDVGEDAVVLYLDFELDTSEQRRRVMMIARGEGLERVPDSFRYMSALGYSSQEAFEAALAECDKHGVRLMILDSLGPALQGDAEASRDVIGFFQRVMEPFRKLGVTVLAIDHQSRQKGGERYQSKSAFGSVFKTNLARSVIQAEPVERKDGMLRVRLRQKKHNFGPLATPFEAELVFGEETVTLTARQLEAGDLAEEETLNTTQRLRLALKDGPNYPEGLAEATGLAVKTVKNNLTQMRKVGEVESTGETDGRTEQVRLASRRPDPYIEDGTKDGEDARSRGGV